MQGIGLSEHGNIQTVQRIVGEIPEKNTGV